MIQKISNLYKNLSKVKKATIWFLICSILQKGIAFFTTPIFTRLMSVEQYGQYSIYIAWFQILTLIASFRLDYDVFNKGMAKYENDQNTYTSTMQIITTVFTILLALVYFVLRDYINSFTELTTSLSILMFVNVIFMNTINFWTAMHRYDYKYKRVVIVTLLLSFATTFISIIAVTISEEKGIARIVSLAFTQIIIGCVIFIAIIRKSKPAFKKDYAKFAINFNLPLIPHFLSLYVLDQSDKIMIQKISGMEKVGLYSVAYSIGIAIVIVANSIYQAIIPWIYGKLKIKDFTEVRKKLLNILLIILLLISFFILMIPELLSIVASKQYSGALYVVLPVAASTYFRLIYNLFGTIEIYYDKNKFSMILSGIAAVTNIILNAIFISLFDYVAAGYTTMICYALLALGHFLYTNHILKENNAYILKNSTMLLLIITMFVIVIIAQFIYAFPYVKYAILLLFTIMVYIKRKAIYNIVKNLKS